MSPVAFAILLWPACQAQSGLDKGDGLEPERPNEERPAPSSCKERQSNVVIGTIVRLSADISVSEGNTSLVLTKAWMRYILLA
ncbi:hypothetical protein MGG_15602 [Pyricularia oryzae 70-15]|uniref:Uncharacterized protein n=3 Tax=Pyricularia oryzae TaxID=318829 RepID=G4MVJ8_PYRO7|nr:uncharacterized protein MGG_15602 [Pyricularia oryzae 70-15]EHA54107.1 hypothetical protein MGG_15602 [Pyricularia oryzae 70-15]ELQ42053.1 hypothetical protein OOU_Y34scaffold00240g60 [Pyricularia oryzae Y34]